MKTVFEMVNISLRIILTILFFNNVDDDQSLEFVWEGASGDVDHYNVYVSTDKGEYVLVGITSETSYTVEGSDGHTYKIKVEAVDAAGNVGPMSEESDPVTVLLPSYADITVLLEGPYASGKTMKTGLTIPTTSPYEDSKKAETIPEDAVDWAYVELRSAEKKVKGESMFLLSDGSIADYKGNKKANFQGVPPGDYYVVIRHRNHLAIMSKSPVSFVKSGDSFIIDLTVKDNVYDGASAVKELSPGICGMYAGDADSNGQIQTIDKNDYWRPQVGTSGYKSGDFNLDGQIQTIDKNDYWRLNVGIGTQVPEP